ncbi:choline transporter-like protein 4 [Salvelinus fontinalis]|uniref:choline transporter-like protein 4 n=1 Tax=Salvelinus fontinalis TaxID=8038 RepID=UPI00248675E7|nr:choline transporter-like protein 4 [Salvelinus fontinalis]
MTGSRCWLRLYRYLYDVTVYQRGKDVQMFGLNKAKLGLERRPVRDHFESNAQFLRRKVMKMKGTSKRAEEKGYAAPYDPFFSGPVRKRSCTDLICCILFLAVIAGYMVMGVLAWLFGDPRHVLFPRNSTGMFCGVGMNRDQPRMIYVDILKCATTTKVMAAALGGVQCPTTQVCVPKCPSHFWMLSAAAYDPDANPKDFFHQQYCDHSLNLTTTTWTVQEILDAELCPSFLVPSKSALGRCLPSLHALKSAPSNFTLPGMASVNETVNSIRSAMGSLISGFNRKAIGVRIFEDFASSWYWILLGLTLALLVSVVFMLLLRYLAIVLVWILMVGLLVVGGYGIWHCYTEYYHFSTSKLKFGDLSFNTNISVYLQVKETWLAFLIILCVWESILILVLSCLRRRLSVAVALMEESSRVVGYLMSTLLYPLFTFVLLVVCVAYWGMTSLYLVTSGAPLYRVVSLSDPSVDKCSLINGSETCKPQTFNSSAYPYCPSVRCIFFKYDDTGLFQQNLVYLQVFNVFAFLWCVNFVIALGQCTLAGTFASYYWAFSKPAEISPFALSQCFIRTLQYHVGSLAFGALLLTCFQLVRLVLEYLNRKTRGSQNACGRFLLNCLRCCFWCLEYFLKILNRNAYIMIAIYGESFCVSAKNAYCLLMRHIGRVVLLDRVTDMLIFFGKLLVVALVGVLAFFFFSGQIRLPGDTFQAEMLNYYWVPILTVMAGAYLIAQGFFSVYSMCIDTLFLCFLEDLERNDGTMQKPYYMSRNLMRILRKPKPFVTALPE